MNVCTFFGHKDAPNDLEPLLHSTIIDLIVNKKVSSFYVGNQGNFDFLVYKVLSKLKSTYPKINYSVVLAYMPSNNVLYSKNSIYPTGIETVPKRFAIIWRNKWMIKQSDYVITYINHSWGGTAKFKEIAEKQNKTVINLS